MHNQVGIEVRLRGYCICQVRKTYRNKTSAGWTWTPYFNLETIL